MLFNSLSLAKNLQNGSGPANQKAAAPKKLTSTTPPRPPSSSAIFVGLTASSMVEGTLFYALESGATRIVTHPQRVTNIKQAMNVVFPYKNIGYLKAGRRLYDGWTMGMTYRIFQRLHKFGLGFTLEHKIPHFEPQLRPVFGDNWKAGGTAVMGTSIGVVEALNPFVYWSDTGQKKMQRLGLSVGQVWQQFRQSPLSFYNGCTKTLGRNALGGSVYWGVLSATEEQLRHRNTLEGKPETLGFLQTMTAATMASVAGVTFSHPFEIGKIIEQSKQDKNPQGLMRLLATGVENEGLAFLTRGMGIRLVRVGPGLTFGYVVSRYAVNWASAAMD